MYFYGDQIVFLKIMVSELLVGLKQGSDIIRFAFYEGYCGSCVESEMDWW